MTNYNERLDDVLTELRSGTINFDDKAKQAITSLIKELVEGAKPEQQKIENMGDTFKVDWARGYNVATDRFEQNLLKALEEVSEMTPQTPEKFTIPAHGHYPEWSVTIEELLTLGRMRRYGRGGWNTKEDLSLSLLGQYHSRAEWEWYDDGKKMKEEWIGRPSMSCRPSSSTTK